MEYPQPKPFNSPEDFKAMKTVLVNGRLARNDSYYVHSKLFCVGWLDAVNSLGHFGPVGVYTEFRRKGLGKAVLQEGLRRMKMLGMGKAMVCCDRENLVARGLYESVGFEYIERLHTLVKGV